LHFEPAQESLAFTAGIERKKEKMRTLGSRNSAASAPVLVRQHKAAWAWELFFAIGELQKLTTRVEFANLIASLLSLNTIGFHFFLCEAIQ